MGLEEKTIEEKKLAALWDISIRLEQVNRTLGLLTRAIINSQPWDSQNHPEILGKLEQRNQQ